MKKIYFLSLLTFFSFNLYCQVHWEKNPGNPVLTTGSAGEWDDFYIGTSSVIYHNNTYHMWYQSGEDTVRIGYATSPDGINWTKDSNNPVMDVGPAGAWDAHWVYMGNVLVIDSIFHMWYTGHTGQEMSKNYQIGHATSPDGIVWTKDPNNPVVGPSESWESTGTLWGKVLYIDGTFQMWYAGSGKPYDPAIGHATSSDGVVWTKYPKNPILTSGDWDSPRFYPGPVIFDGSTYQMWYFGGGSNSQKIGYATSEDGKQWVKYGPPVLREGPSGSWDDLQVAMSSVLFDSTKYKYKMWYMGVPNSGWENSGI